MSGVIPTDLESIDKEIYELLLGTPETTNRGRLMHLINAKAALGGVGGGGASSTAIKLGEFTTVDDPASVTMVNGTVFVNNETLRFSGNAAEFKPLPYEYGFSIHMSDFIYYLDVELEGGQTTRITLYGMSGASGENGYCIGHRFPSPAPLPPLFAGTKITIYAQPVALGSHSDRTMGECVASCDLIDMGISVDASSFFQRNPDARVYHAGVDNVRSAAFTAIAVKSQETSFHKLRALKKYNGYGMTSQTAVSVEFFVGGVYHSTAYGTLSGTVEQFEPPTDGFYFTISNRGTDGNDYKELTDQDPINMRIYVTGVA